VKRLGPAPILYADKVETQSRTFTVRPGRIWVQATRGDKALFEETIELAADETKTVTIGTK
jgi:hypothetical protein